MQTTKAMAVASCMPRNIDKRDRLALMARFALVLSGLAATA